MNNKHNKKTNLSCINIITVLLVVLYISFYVATIVISKSFSNLPMNKRNIFLAFSVPGFFSMINFVICIVITIINHKKGAHISRIILLISGLMSIRGSIIDFNGQALLGSFMSLIGIVVITILNKQFVTILNSEKILKNQAITDPLTGLLNRRGALDSINEMIESNDSFYLLFLDLDDFKNINDTLGHKVGDFLLKEISKRWEKLVVPGGLVARNGGDEFLFVLPDDGVMDVNDYMKSIIDSLSNGIIVNNSGASYQASVSIGSSHYPKDCNNIEDLMKYADMAMYSAKTNGKKGFCAYNSGMKQRVEYGLELEMYLHKAIKNDLFYFAFQPVFSTDNKNIKGFEALLRLKDDNGKPIGPGDFIPVAERSNLIIDIDNYVLRKVMTICKDFILEHNKKYYISVNVSANHITHCNFVDEIKEILDDIGFPPECLVIEMTEYCYVKSVEQAINTFKGLNNLGIKIALDDFGTGYASLSYLSKMPIDVLKIDKAFVDNLGKDDESKDFINAIISMGHTLGCTIVSEGVETEEQLSLLKVSDCDYIQGYVWSMPVSFDEIVKLTTNN